MSDWSVLPGATWADLAPRLADLLSSAPRGEDGATRSRVVVATSGSSGTPKRVRLSGTALRASGEATASVLGAPGRWVLALPTHHVAGLQVLARSVLAGTSPVALDPGMPFSAATFAAAVERAGDGGQPVYASLVPTQLHRLLRDPTGAGPAALAGVGAVLLGGAAADRSLVQEAGGITRVLTTYGMTETCGGCVYDGTPLPGVAVRIDPAGDRIQLGGPVLADGYVDQPQLTAERFVTDDGRRWFVTDDRGAWQDGRLTVLGRVDDVIITGGHKVEPRDVEAALRSLPDVAEALVVAVPDQQWGQLVGALLTRSALPGDPPSPAAIRDALAPSLPPHALPRRVGWCDGIPLLPSGKPDRARATTLLETLPAR